MKQRAKPARLSSLQVGVGGIKGVGIDPARAQGLQHPGTRHERDFALGGRTAHEHGDLAQGLHVNFVSNWLIALYHHAL